MVMYQARKQTKKDHQQPPQNPSKQTFINFKIEGGINHEKTNSLSQWTLKKKFELYFPY